MPIFEYRCQACGHVFDALQKAGEGALRKCPECGKLRLKKALSAPSFHLKGSGWYKTDFRDRKKPKSDSEPGKPAHAMDTAQEHSHDHGGEKADKGGAKHDHDHGHSHGHSHSHGGHSHSHGPGGHKH